MAKPVCPSPIFPVFCPTWLHQQSMRPSALCRSFLVEQLRIASAAHHFSKCSLRLFRCLAAVLLLHAGTATVPLACPIISFSSLRSCTGPLPLTLLLCAVVFILALVSPSTAQMPQGYHTYPSTPLHQRRVVFFPARFVSVIHSCHGQHD